jgi:monofunctional biosynthetic peptidoglycan transglycosylase
LEVYLNVVEFGDGIYGIDAASRRLFGKPPERLTRRECCRLAAVLPSPKRMDAARPSPYVRQRAGWIQRQIRQMGEAAVLARLAP